ncbi:MAG TPA: ABC transporter permease [Trueperaceae bacterium]
MALLTNRAASPVADSGKGRGRRALAFLKEAKYEFLKLWRLPVYSLSTLVFPAMFYVIFGLTFAGQYTAGVSLTTYMLATYGAFGVIGCALFGFGVAVAVERGQGWMLLKRASPMPPLVYFAAKLAMALLFSGLVITMLFSLGALVGGVRLPVLGWLQLFLTLLAGALPFSMMGLAFGYLLGPNSAPAVLNLVYLPMAFVSGLWIPIDVLPQAIRQFAPLLPPYHYSQLALGTIGADRGGDPLLHLAVLAGYTLLFLAVALVGYRRDEGRTFG